MSEWAWKRSKTRKRVIWQMGQKQMVMNADCIHVTSDDELNQVRKVRAGGPVAVIPNGVHCPELPVRSKPTDRARRTVLFLARIHPTKGVDILLEAWRALGKATCDWDLQVAGPRNHAFATKMMQLGHSYGLKNVDFIGEVTGAAKSQTFINADLYVLPTHSENFGISVAEALAHGVPAIVFEGAPWSGLNEKEAGWWIPRSVESLTETLRLAFAVGDVRRAEMGRNGRAWVEEEFDWGVVGLRMAGVYGWLTGGPRPQCVDIG
jgi:glycosyltransferase involved in cell wall biosynthesis